jgi:tyrosine-specific transport protein
MNNVNRLLGAILLIAGTSIGAGMLALPVVTAEYGFIPTLALFVICWAGTTMAALVMLEANLWFPVEANLISMSKETLGKWGEGVSWAVYLLLLYSLMSAYLTGMNELLEHGLMAFNIQLSPLGGSIILISLFGIIIYLGVTTIDYINRLLMAGLLVSYLTLVFLISPHVELARLAPLQIKNSWVALPIIITSFGYQIIIPSLRSYLNSDVKKIRLAIIIGSFIPLCIYLLWEILILGVLPLNGPNGLLTILESGQPATGVTLALEKILNHPFIGTVASFLAFYAIATSFIGVSLSLFDFLGDGFHIKKTKFGRFLIACITFIPPLIFAFTYPHGFIIALGFAGIFVAILLIILPTIIVISGRYWKKIPSHYRIFGGLTALIALILFSLMIIVAQIMVTT